MAGKIDFTVFTTYWDALKRALVVANVHGSGIGETGRSFLNTPPVAGAVIHEPSEGSPIDISDHHAHFTIYYTTEDIYDTTPTVMFSNGFDGEFIREEDPVKMPAALPGETLRSQTLRWIDLINARTVTVINEVNKGPALAGSLQRVLTPVLLELFPPDMPNTSPEMPLDGLVLVYDVARNFFLVGVNNEPLISPY